MKALDSYIYSLADHVFRATRYVFGCRVARKTSAAHWPPWIRSSYSAATSTSAGQSGLTHTWESHRFWALTPIYCHIRNGV